MSSFLCLYLFLYSQNSLKWVYASGSITNFEQEALDYWKIFQKILYHHSIFNENNNCVGIIIHFQYFWIIHKTKCA